jgi:hypothetical protein
MNSLNIATEMYHQKKVSGAEEGDTAASEKEKKKCILKCTYGTYGSWNMSSSEFLIEGSCKRLSSAHPQQGLMYNSVQLSDCI